MRISSKIKAFNWPSFTSLLEKGFSRGPPKDNLLFTPTNKALQLKANLTDSLESDRLTCIINLYAT